MLKAPFKDKVVVVTGAASGIGLAICRRFSLDGAKIGMLDMDAPALDRAGSEFAGKGADCLCVRGWAIEVKRQEALSRPAWWRQAVVQAERAGQEPMLLYRRSREAWTAWIHTRDGMWREGTLIDAAQAIREKWASWP